MNHLDLFSGIGGFALAAQKVWGSDHNILSFCEIDSYCQKVLKKHWPETPCHDDIKTLKGANFETVDLLTGGFPCQPFSVAGEQGGAKDDRHLWPEMFRVIEETDAYWVIGENVTGIISMLEFEQCILDLENAGYQVQTFIIPACAVDAKHRRDRAWIVAYNQSKAIRGGLCESKPAEIWWRRFSNSSSQEHVANANGNRLQRKSKFNESERACREFEPWCAFTGSNSQARPTGSIWPTEPKLGRVANGISHRVDRLRGLGNAIVPQVVIPIMQAIKEINKLCNITHGY